jgi:hypothetical protein
MQHLIRKAVFAPEIFQHDQELSENRLAQPAQKQTFFIH